ncbi:hypothetical protein FWD20_01170 [Candidatus Saccharibacteria bacterium]|nr:hypothetical protein [Candidatus Saccharibacteria bacterium]
MGLVGVRALVSYGHWHLLTSGSDVSEGDQDRARLLIEEKVRYDTLDTQACVMDAVRSILPQENSRVWAAGGAALGLGSGQTREIFVGMTDEAVTATLNDLLEVAEIIKEHIAMLSAGNPPQVRQWLVDCGFVPDPANPDSRPKM